MNRSEHKSFPLRLLRLGRMRCIMLDNAYHVPKRWAIDCLCSDQHNTKMSNAIFENLIADFFAKMGRKLYYYHKDSGLEIDFVIRWRGECVLVEVKAETGNAKSAATILKHPEKYHVNQCIKLGNYNVGRSGKILTLPLYMGFLLYEV